MQKLLFIINIIWSIKVIAMNVIPPCEDISTMANSRIYSNYNVDNDRTFYTNGMDNKYLFLARNQCINGEEPGIFKSTLVLKQDGNLVNYVYDIQNSLTYITFASNTSSYGVSSALFYLDTKSGFKNIMIDLMGPDLTLIKQIIPIASKTHDKTLSGSLALSGITPQWKNSAILGLTTYDASNGLLYQYPYNPTPVKYIDLYFDRHTLETRDAKYLITILDQFNNQKRNILKCQLPFTTGDCYSKIKYIGANHYIVYLEENMKIEIARFIEKKRSKRTIYFEYDDIIFGWNDSNYYIPLNSNINLSATAYNWIPSMKDNSSTLHLLSWDDTPTLPNDDYSKMTCDMDSMTFNSGILSGNCLYLTEDIVYWVYSSLDYDKTCKNDPKENDVVTNRAGVLTCM